MSAHGLLCAQLPSVPRPHAAPASPSGYRTRPRSARLVCIAASGFSSLADGSSATSSQLPRWKRRPILLCGCIRAGSRQSSEPVETCSALTLPPISCSLMFDFSISFVVVHSFVVVVSASSILQTSQSSQLVDASERSSALSCASH